MEYDGEIESIIINGDSPTYQIWITKNVAYPYNTDFINEIIDGDYNYKKSYAGKTFKAGDRIRVAVGRYNYKSPKNVFVKINIKYDLSKPLVDGPIVRD